MWNLALWFQAEEIALGKAATAPLETGLEIASVIGVIIVLILVLRRR